MGINESSRPSTMKLVNQCFLIFMYIFTYIYIYIYIYISYTYNVCAYICDIYVIYIYIHT